MGNKSLMESKQSEKSDESGQKLRSYCHLRNCMGEKELVLRLGGGTIMVKCLS